MSDNSTKNYTVFGLFIESELTLDELTECPDNFFVNIEIKLGKVDTPADDLKDTTYRPHVIYNNKMFYLNYEGIASYLVTKSNDKTYITVDVADRSEMSAVYLRFYGSVFMAALQMNGRFPIHASAISVNDRLHMFAGPSGIGKSTLAAQLLSRGYSVFSDDKCVLHWDGLNSQFLAEPSMQIMRLWEDAASNLENLDKLENPVLLLKELDKYQYSLKREDRITNRVPVHCIYVIRNVPKESRMEFVEQKGVPKIRILKNQTHGYRYVYGLGQAQAHWSFMTQLVNNLPVCLIKRPLGTDINDFVNFVENHLKKYTYNQSLN